MPWNKNTNIKDAGIWLSRKIGLIEEKNQLLTRQQIKIIRTGKNQPIKTIYRAGIFHAEMGIANIGGEKNKTRPVVVMSPNNMNKGHTVIVVPLSTKYQLKPDGTPLYDNQYLLKKTDYPELDADSMVKFEDVRSVDVVRLRGHICNVTKIDMKRMKKCLLSSMGY
jgi:mRNA interferase MazF